MIKAQLGPVRANSLTVRRSAPLLLTGLLVFGIGAAGHYYVPSLEPLAQGEVRSLVSAAAPVVERLSNLPPVQAATTAAQEVGEMASAAVSSKPEYYTREVELGSGQSFSDMLTDAAVAPENALAASGAMNKVYPHHKLKAGQEVSLSFMRSGEDETLTGVAFMPEPTKEITITRGDDGTYAAQLKTIPLERQRVAAKGTINGSLYAAGAKQGVPRSIMAAVIRAYSHAIDFQRDIHPGDKFEVLYDQPTARDGTPVGQGVVIYAALEVGGKVKPLYRVTFGDGTIDYFDAAGKSVRRALLRTPVDGARITSGYGMRFHPILGFSKMHKGVDFGAPPGTPILAAGSGTVVEAGFKGAYGRYVRIRHNGRLETAYAHMSRYARNMYQGARVNQGDVIGFVGSSGRTTGPHLHFEVHVDGTIVNPMSVNLPTGRVLDGQALTQFKQGQNRIRSEFSELLTKDATPQVRPVAAPAPLVPNSKPEQKAPQPAKPQIEAAAPTSPSLLTKINATGPAFPPAKQEACGTDKGC